MSSSLIACDGDNDPLAALFAPPSERPMTRFPYIGFVNPKTNRAKAMAMTQAIGNIEDGDLFAFDPVTEQFFAVEGRPVFMLDSWTFYAEEVEQKRKDGSQVKRLVNVVEKRDWENEAQKQHRIVALLHLLPDGFFCTVSKLTGAQSRFARDIAKEQARYSSPMGVRDLAKVTPEAASPQFPVKLRVKAILRGDASQSYIACDVAQIGPIKAADIRALFADVPALTDALRIALSVFEERKAFYRSLGSETQDEASESANQPDGDEGSGEPPARHAEAKPADFEPVRARRAALADLVRDKADEDDIPF